MLSWRVHVRTQRSLRCRVSVPFELLGDYMNCDMYDIEQCGEMLAAIRSIELGDAQEWSRGGNGYTVVVRRDGATFQEIHLEKRSFIVPIKELAALVREWKACLESEEKRYYESQETDERIERELDSALSPNSETSTPP